MPKFFAPADKPADWQRLLAKPVLHWKTGRSAKSIAYSWTEAQGFPSEVQSVFDESAAACLHELEFLLGIPEHEVPLPGGDRPSQNDVFVLAMGADGLVSIAVGSIAVSFRPLGPEQRGIAAVLTLALGMTAILILVATMIVR